MPTSLCRRSPRSCSSKGANHTHTPTSRHRHALHSVLYSLIHSLLSPCASLSFLLLFVFFLFVVGVACVWSVLPPSLRCAVRTAVTRFGGETKRRRRKEKKRTEQTKKEKHKRNNKKGNNQAQEDTNKRKVFSPPTATPIRVRASHRVRHTAQLG